MSISEKEWYIEAPWGRLCIVAWGHCYNPPVLLCHGVMDSIISFRPLIQLLPKDFYYIGIDFPGCGKSDPFPSGLLMSFFDLVYCIEVVVKHHRWESFLFMGHSAGAGVGLLYNFCFPDKITKLIQLDSVTPAVVPELFPKWYKRIYQHFFDDYDYYNTAKERRPVYTEEEALKKIMKAVGANLEQAGITMRRVTEHVGNGLLRFTYDQRYKIIAYPPFSPEQLKTLRINSKTVALHVPTDQSIKHGWYTTMPYLIDESNNNNSLTVKIVEGHHNIHVSHPERVANIVTQFMLYGPQGLDTKAKL